MAQTAKNVKWLSALVVQVAVPESGALVDIGGTKDGVLLEGSESGSPVFFDENATPIGTPLESTDMTLAIIMMETTADNLALAIPGSDVLGNVVTLGSNSLRKTCKVVATGTDRLGKTHIISWEKAEILGKISLAFSRKTASECAIGFRAIIPDTGSNTITITPPA